MEKKVIEGVLFHEIEVLGNKKFEHFGFRDKNNQFGELIAEFVPIVGMTKKARLTIEALKEKR